MILIIAFTVHVYRSARSGHTAVVQRTGGNICTSSVVASAGTHVVRRLTLLHIFGKSSDHAVHRKEKKRAMKKRTRETKD